MKLDGWSLIAAFLAGFFVSAMLDNWLMHRHPEWVR